MAFLEQDLSLLVRVFAAAAFAAVLGFEREAAHRYAGLRTHMLVGIAASLFTVLALVAATAYEGNDDTLRIDPTRVIQSIALGIGFLGSGVVFISRKDDNVHGLTTAASIWATAAVGVAAGFERYVLAGGVTLLALIILGFLPLVETRIRARHDAGEPSSMRE